MHRDPYQDDRLNDGEKALYGEIYPAISAAEERLQADLGRLILCNIVRRLVTRGADIDELLEEARYHAEHQAAFNARTIRSH